MFLVYPQGVRIVVHTANLIYVDWNNKSQGLWMQDFPWKNSNPPNKGSGFESDLVDYLTALKVHTTNVPWIVLSASMLFLRLCPDYEKGAIS